MKNKTSGAYLPLIIGLIILLLTHSYILNYVMNTWGELNVRDMGAPTVLFPATVLSELNSRYSGNNEYLLCLLGREENGVYVVESVYQPKVIEQTPTSVRYEQDPPCQIENSLGAIHSHLDTMNNKLKAILCNPSENDLFTFGEMRNPEPKIFAIQCGINKFAILEQPKPTEPLDMTSLNWGVQ